MGRSEFEESFEGDGETEAVRAREEQRLGEMILNAPIRALEPCAAIGVSATTSIREAIQVMIDHHIGAVLVTDRSQQPVGIFTERDVLHRVALSGIDKDRPVADVMTREPEVLGLDDGIAFALNRMIVRGYRHIPIVAKDGKPVAVLSVREVVSFIVSLLPGRVLNLPPEPSLGIPQSPDGG